MSKKHDIETHVRDEIPEWQRAMNLIPDTLVNVNVLDGSQLQCTFDVTIVAQGPSILAIRVIKDIGTEVMIPWHAVVAVTPVKRKRS